MRRHGKSNSGQGVTEVVVVIVLFGATLAAAVPTYLGLQGRRADKTAKESLVAAVPIAEAYRQDHGSYSGMDATDLLRIDPRVSPTLTVASAGRHRYCLANTVHGKTWSIRGPYHADPPLTANGTCS